MSYLDDLFALDGKVAIITGGARGIGKALVTGFVKVGASVIIIDKLNKELTETTKQLLDDGFNVLGLNYDITVQENITKAVEYTVKTFGRIDILINCAGITIPQDSPYPDGYWDETIDTNLRAPFKLMREVSKHMMEKGSGSIINITSLNAQLGFPNNPAYLASKGGLKMMSKGFALDLGKYGIRVNNLGPGYTRAPTSMKSYNDPVLRAERSARTILGRWAEPEEMVGTAIFLASNASSYITGQDIYVDGGWSAKGL